MATCLCTWLHLKDCNFFCWILVVLLLSLRLLNEVRCIFIYLNISLYIGWILLYCMLEVLISYSLQLLVSLKVRYPQRITILRGNHESRQVCLHAKSSFVQNYVLCSWGSYIGLIYGVINLYSLMPQKLTCLGGFLVA